MIVRIWGFVTGLLLASTAAAAVEGVDSPPIRVDLRAPWGAAPILLEALEAVSSVKPSAFFDAVGQLSKAKGIRNDLTEEQIYKLSKETLKAKGFLAAPAAEQLWDLALALRSESPKVEAFWHLYNTTSIESAFLEQVSDPTECGSFAWISGKVICDKKTLDSQLASARSTEELEVPFDHVLTPQGNTASIPTVVLYADFLSSNFESLHTALSTHAEGKTNTPIKYVFRWRPNPAKGNVFLSGYGAILDLKKVDYLVLDDRKLKTAGAEYADEKGYAKDRKTTEQAVEDRKWLQKVMGAKSGSGHEDVGHKLSAEELTLLGYKAVQVILASGDPIRALKELSQNFPFHAKQLAAVELKEETELELQNNQNTRVEAGSNDVWLNGKVFPRKDFSPLGLLTTIKQESALVDSLTSADGPIGLPASKAIDLLSNSTLGRAFVGASTETVLVDASDRIERGLRSLSGELLDPEKSNGTRAITWWNDLEKDPAFATWSDDLQMLLRPLWPGSFPQIRKNIFHVITTLDLSRKESARLLAESVFPASRRVGLRWGFVPFWTEENKDAVRLARMFFHVWDSVGPEGTAKYLRRVGLSGMPNTPTIDIAEAAQEFKAALGSVEDKEDTERVLQDILSEEPSYAQARIDSAQSWVTRVGASAKETPRGLIHVNGWQFPLNQAFSQNIGQIVQAQLQTLAAPIFYGKLKSDQDLSTYFYDLEDTLTFKSPLLNDASLFSKAINLATLSTAARKPLEAYIGKREASSNVTIWVTGDLDSSVGKSLARAALLALDTTNFQLGFLHVPSRSSDHAKEHLSTALEILLTTESKVGHVQLVSLFDDSASNDTAVAAALTKASEAQSQDEARKWWQETSDSLPYVSSEPGLIANGKYISGFDSIASQDIAALASFEASKRGNKVHAQLASLGIKPTSLQVTLVASALAADYEPDEAAQGLFQSRPSSRLDAFDLIEIGHSGFEIGDRSKARFRFAFVLDPISETAQRWASVLEMVSTWPDTYIKVILNPLPSSGESPLPRFYRYSSPAAPSFEDGQISSNTIKFLGMPEDAVLTLGLDTPSPWLAMAEEAIYDLDNIKLGGLPTDARLQGVEATYELKKILIEGHARDTSTSEIPRGLQLILETTDASERLDTIVMANLAYFQFRAKPGLWHLKIRDGKSSEVYQMDSVGNLGWDSPPANVTGDVVTLASLHGLTIYPRVGKRAGMEDQELLEDLDDGQAPSVVGAAKSALGSLTKKLTPKPTNPHAEINIFTVASGHLYERMTYIMILSVLRHTKHSVKFWFIENFLSPSFKEFIPHFAKEYGFTYELVSYAWPHWLRGQKEKQRVIWGNKILFLDVLFPLDLDKVIFVDADQIVRTDMIELVNVDLKGAPYGYPPMGDDSYDMDGFRFWKQGYWKDFLRDKPYHISALYVVDLVRFRQVAAGDRLRGQYQALSADPHSLSNLDQDLPNNLQYQLPIHTLDKEWLWCETWCSSDWLDKAKTIDLCSNPKTKEPKLDRARRQIPEWTVLDDEVAQFAAKLSEQNIIGKNVVSKTETVKDAEADSAPEQVVLDDSSSTHAHDEL